MLLVRVSDTVDDTAAEDDNQEKTGNVGRAERQMAEYSRVVDEVADSERG